MKSRRTASSSAVPKTLSRVMSRSASPPVSSTMSPGVLPEGGDLDHLAAAEVDVGQPEAPPDEAAVPEDGPHLARVGVGGDVEVLGRVAEEQVAHAAAHEVGLVVHVPQPGDHLERLGVEPLDGDLRLRGRGAARRADRAQGRAAGARASDRRRSRLGRGTSGSALRCVISLACGRRIGGRPWPGGSRARERACTVGLVLRPLVATAGVCVNSAVGRAGGSPAGRRTARPGPDRGPAPGEPARTTGGGPGWRPAGRAPRSAPVVG